MWGCCRWRIASFLLLAATLNCELYTRQNTCDNSVSRTTTIQYNTIQYNTIQYNTIQYNTIQYNTIQYNTIQYNKTLLSRTGKFVLIQSRSVTHARRYFSAFLLQNRCCHLRSCFGAILISTMVSPDRRLA